MDVDARPDRAEVVRGPAEFEGWIAPHLRVLAAVARRLAGAEGPDLVQETLLRAWRSWDSYAPDAGSPRSWLLTILTNEVRRAARRRSADPLPDQLDLPARTPDQSDRVAVETAVRSLSARQQQTVVLFYFADLSVAEAAGVLDVSTGTVKAHLAAARERLRTLLEDR